MDTEYLNVEKNYFMKLKKNFDIMQYIRWSEFIPKNVNQLIEIGCGGGIFAASKPKYYKTKLIGIDINPHAVNYCRNTKNYYKTILSSGLDLPFESNSIEMIYADQVIEHIEKPLKFFQEAYRVLKKGGKLVLIAPSPYNPHFYEDYTHMIPYVPNLFKNLALDSSFDIIRTDWIPHFKGLGSLMRFLKKPIFYKLFKFIGKLPLIRSKYEAYIIAAKR